MPAANLEFTPEQLEGRQQARNDQRNSRVVWFEIPVDDLDRAKAFYEAVFAFQLEIAQFGPERIAVFPYQPPAISGCLIEAPNLKPGRGAIPCLNADPCLDDVLDRVEANGGVIVHPYAELPPGMGCFARIQDSEGNLIGLHAMQ
jgi:predicted enzyme related to lactoylglutathione lyase